MKYKLTEEVKSVGVKTLHRIEALKDFANVKKGDKGGWIQKETNLSQEGDAWVSGEACVFDNARVYGDAELSDCAWVYGNAQIYGNARVYGDARVYGNAQIYEDAWISLKAWVYGNARVYGNADVSDYARVYGDAWVFGNARIYDDSIICDGAEIHEGGQIDDSDRSRKYKGEKMNNAERIKNNIFVAEVYLRGFLLHRRLFLKKKDAENYVKKFKDESFTTKVYKLEVSGIYNQKRRKQIDSI